MQITSTGIAVALAVVVAIGMLFFGPNVFGPFKKQEADMSTTTLAGLENATSTSNPSMNDSGPALPTQLPNELTGSDVAVGTGKEAVPGSKVTVNYVGMLPDGTVFDASAKHQETAGGFTFTLGAGQVIRGWDFGVAVMKEGGRRRLIIPAAYAYGQQGVPGVIPPNATLIFDVELLKVQ